MMVHMIRLLGILIVTFILAVPSTLAINVHPIVPESGRLGDGVVTFYRPDENLRATFFYRTPSGRYNTKVLEEINQFFHCRLTKESHWMDPNLIEILDEIEDHFNAREVKLISTYRSPTRNAMMRAMGRGVARDSLHLHGKASDIEIDGIPAEAIRNFAFALNLGGVGYYGRSSFVHIDTGAKRTWGWHPITNARTATAQK